MTLFNKKAITVAHLTTLLGTTTSTYYVVSPNNLEVVDSSGKRIGTIDLVSETFIALKLPTSSNLVS